LKQWPQSRKVYNIPVYSPQLLDHFEHPRNAGTLPKAQASAQVENPVCGDVLKLSASLQGEQIAEIRFQAKGCVPSMACGSALTELARGKTLAAAASLKVKDVLAAVGGVPPASAHAAQLAIDALRALLAALARL
jgi:nitrogen fixation protein NifU and related proteins